MWEYTQEHANNFPNICHLEAIKLLIAYKTLAPMINTSPANIIIFTDNIASSYALQTGRAKDYILGSCARELWLRAANFNHNIEIKHKSGSLIPLAEALSRMLNNPEKAAMAHQIIAAERLQFVPLVLNDYNFFNHFL